MDEVTYSGYIKINPEDLTECEKTARQLIFEHWLESLSDEDKECLLHDCEYIIEAIKKEKENA